MDKSEKTVGIRYTLTETHESTPSCVRAKKGATPYNTYSSIVDWRSVIICSMKLQASGLPPAKEGTYTAAVVVALSQRERAKLVPG